MVDVGAHVGHSLLPFTERGWRVHAFEPDPANRALLALNVADFDGVTIDPRAVSDAPGRLMLYGSSESTGISSLTPFTPSHEPIDDVEVTTLADYMEATGLSSVAFLKIDVEGWERNVLNGYPWDRGAPDAVLLEFEDRKTEQLGYFWTDLADLLVTKGYAVLVSEWYPIVAYGTQHRWRAFRRYPSDLSDPNAWGNLIAVRPELMPRLERIARLAALRYRVARFVRRSA
jgi:FkbM family methyltransferase